MMFKLVSAVFVILIIGADANSLRITNKSSSASYTSTVEGSNMPISWQVKAAEYLADVLELYSSDEHRSAGLSELFSLDHSNYSWFVVINASYLYNPINSYYVTLRTIDNDNEVTYTLFSGNSVAASSNSTRKIE